MLRRKFQEKHKQWACFNERRYEIDGHPKSMCLPSSIEIGCFYASCEIEAVSIKEHRLPINQYFKANTWAFVQINFYMKFNLMKHRISFKSLAFSGDEKVMIRKNIVESTLDSFNQSFGLQML